MAKVMLLTSLVYPNRRVATRGIGLVNCKVSRNHLSELLAAYPALQLLTGDAIYAQRPLLELLKVEGCD